MNKQNAILALVAIAIVIGVSFYAVGQLGLLPNYATPSVIPPKYTTGELVKFSLTSTADGSAITADAAVKIYESDANPFAKSFNGVPVTSASYSSADGCWEATLDAGTYIVLVTDTGSPKAFYPTMQTITVGGSNDDDNRATWASPSTIKMDTRADITIGTPVIKEWNESANAFQTVETFNTTSATQWQITYTIDAAGAQQVLKDGYLFWSDVDGLTITDVSIDGAKPDINVATSTSADLPSLTGTYVQFSQLNGGDTSTVKITLTSDSTEFTGTLKLTQFDYGMCLRSGSTLRWWSPETDSISIVEAS